MGKLPNQALAMLPTLDLVALVLVLIGALNWLYVGIVRIKDGSSTGCDDVLSAARVPGEVASYVYVLVGAAGVVVALNMHRYGVRRL